jgi:hypothetical protein
MSYCDRIIKINSTFQIMDGAHVSTITTVSISALTDSSCRHMMLKMINSVFLKLMSSIVNLYCMKWLVGKSEIYGT